MSYIIKRDGKPTLKFERHPDAPFEFEFKARETVNGEYVSALINFWAAGAETTPFDCFGFYYEKNSNQNFFESLGEYLIKNHAELNNIVAKYKTESESTKEAVNV